MKPLYCFTTLYTTSRNPSTPKDWCQDSRGPDQFPAPKSPSENNYHLFNSRFWHHFGVKILGTKTLISWPIFYFFMLIWRPLRQLTQSKKFHFYIFYGFLRNVVLKLMPWCQVNGNKYLYIYRLALYIVRLLLVLPIAIILRVV